MPQLKAFTFLILLLCFACDSKKPIPQKNIQSKADSKSQVLSTDNNNTLNLTQANNLAALPLECMQVEYPNKLGQVLASSKELGSPRNLHPAFYGCFDWHSAVHGHWSLVYLLKKYPNLEKREEIIKKLQENISKENILKEVEYFAPKHNSSYERTYGWAWILKLSAELHTWEDPIARKLELNLKPLTDLIVEKYLSFLPKLIYPIRVGEHTNTAFGLCFAYDYAEIVKNSTLKNLISKRAKAYYIGDVDCPLSWEPSGYDFLSPCLEEVDLMRRILSKEEFKKWFNEFLPSAQDESFYMEVGKVSDRNDGKLVHLDGLNFSRAWVIYGLANQYPEYKYLVPTADKHVSHSLPNLVGDSYEGGHWLGSFAIYALQQELNEN